MNLVSNCRKRSLGPAADSTAAVAYWTLDIDGSRTFGSSPTCMRGCRLDLCNNKFIIWGVWLRHMLDSQTFVLGGCCTGLGVDYTLRAGDRGGGGRRRTMGGGYPGI